MGERPYIHAFRGEGGGYILLDQIRNREPYDGLFYYDVYTIERGIGDAVGGEAWFTIERRAGCQRIVDGDKYMTTMGFLHPCSDALLLLNTVPPGMYFVPAGVTYETVREVMATTQQWWWPAWLTNGPMGFVFTDETDLVLFAGLDAVRDRP